jgi:hypothetical protein
MNPVFLVAAAGFMVLGAGFIILFARLIFSDTIPAFSDEIESIFSLERYHEMERWLELRLLSQQGGSTPELRKERVNVFRGYIHQLCNDFNRISRALKMIMINSQVDRPDLAGALMKQQFLFTLAIMAVEFELIFFRFGWNGGGSIAESLHLLSAQLQNLAAIAQPEAAYY